MKTLVTLGYVMMLAACGAVPALHPRVLHLSAAEAYVYDTLLIKDEPPKPPRPKWHCMVAPTLGSAEGLREYGFKVKCIQE